MDLTALDLYTKNRVPLFPSTAEGRRGGLMVRALDSGLSGPGLSPGWGTALCS